MVLTDFVVSLVTEAEERVKRGMGDALAMFNAQLACALAPDSADAQRAVGLCASRAGFPRFAQSLLGAALRLEPGNTKASLYLAEAQMTMRQNGEAHSVLRNLSVPPSERAEWAALQAEALRRVEGDGAALDFLQQELTRDPELAALRLRLAEGLERVGRREEALKELARVDCHGEDAVNAWQLSLDMAFRAGAADSALALMEQATLGAEASRRSCRPLVPIADCGWDAASLGRMRQILEQARVLAPDPGKLAEIEARLRVVEGRVDDARAELTRGGAAVTGAAGLELGLLCLAAGEEPPLALPDGVCRSHLATLLAQRQRAAADDIDITFAAMRRLLGLVLSSNPKRLARWVEVGTDPDPLRPWVLAYLESLDGLGDVALAHHRRFAAQAAETQPGSMLNVHLALCMMVQAQGNDNGVDRLWDQYLAEDITYVMVVSQAFAVLGQYPGGGETLAAALSRQAWRLPKLTAARADGGAIWGSALLAAAFLDGDDRRFESLTAQALDYFRIGAEPVALRSVPAQPADMRRRVGYVMTDFQHQDLPPEQHAITFHDLSRFDVRVYTFTPEATAHVRPHRPRPPTLVGWPGQVVSIDRLPAQSMAERIAADGLDVLVDTVGWWAQEIPSLFLRRPAPVQVTWLGLGRPGLAGAIDYIVGNEILFDRDADHRYPEKFIRLSGSYIPPKPLPAAVPVMPRRLLGLPEHAFVFLGYHQMMKVTWRSLRLWMEILARTPDSRLVLPPLDRLMVTKLAERAGVDPHRLHVFDWVGTELENMSRIGAADVYLDTVPFNSAGLTGYDAILMNVPRVSLRGPNLYSRFGHILSAAMGLDDLVCGDETDYIQLAVRLHDDPALLASMRKRMAAARQTSRAMAPDALIRGLESAWDRIVDRYRRGLPAIGFDVPPE